MSAGDLGDYGLWPTQDDWVDPITDPANNLYVGTVDAVRYVNDPVLLEINIVRDKKGRDVLQIGPYHFGHFATCHLFQLLSVSVTLLAKPDDIDSRMPAARARRLAISIWRHDLARNARGVTREGVPSEGETLP